MTEPCQGPDPHPRPPKIAPPAGACDTHAHVFGPLDRFPFSPGRGYTPPEATPEDFKSLLSVLGIDRAVIVHGSAHGTDNRASANGIAALGDDCRGVAVVEPDISDGDLQALHDQGFRGVRLSTVVKGGIGTGHLTRMAERVSDLGWHVVLHLNKAEEIAELRDQLAAFPTPFVVDHLGRVRGGQGKDHVGFQALLGLLRDVDDAWVKISSWYRLSDEGPPYDDMRPMAEALMETRPDRVLWGSNWPHPMFKGPMPNDGTLLDQFMEWAGSDAVRQAVLVDNPDRLYGFSRKRAR